MISKKHKLILLVPPKTGSNSIKKCFEDANIVFDSPIKKLQFPIYHSTLSEILLAYDISYEDLNKYKILQITRNPYERYMSSWIHQNEIIGFETKIEIFTENLKKYKNLLRIDINQFYIKFYGSLNYRDKFYKNNNWGGLRFWWEQNWWNDLEVPIKNFKLENIKNDINELSKYVNIELNMLPKIRPNMDKNNNYDYINHINIVKNDIMELYINDFKLYNYDI